MSVYLTKEFLLTVSTIGLVLKYIFFYKQLREILLIPFLKSSVSM